MLLAVIFISFLISVHSLYVALYAQIPGECSFDPQNDQRAFTLPDECQFFAGYVCSTMQTFSSFKTDCAATESIFIYDSGDCSGPVKHIVWGEINQLYITDDNQTVPISCVYTK